MFVKKKIHGSVIRNYAASSIALLVFIVPIFLLCVGVVSVISARDIRSVGTVQLFHSRIIDQTPYPLTPFHTPIVSLTFDDGWESVYTAAFPLLQQYGFHTTQYVISDTVDNPLYMSLGQLQAMHNAGSDIAGHTVSHPDLTTLSAAQLTHELADSQTTLRKDFGSPIRDFTSPYGAYNDYTLSAISQYYRSQKNAEGDPASNELEAINVRHNFNPLNIVSYSIRSTTTLDDLKKLVQSTIDNNGWLVLTYHQINADDGIYSISRSAFTKQMQYLSVAPLRSATVGEVLDAALPLIPENN